MIYIGENVIKVLSASVTIADIEGTTYAHFEKLHQEQEPFDISRKKWLVQRISCFPKICCNSFNFHCFVREREMERALLECGKSFEILDCQTIIALKISWTCCTPLASFYFTSPNSWTVQTVEIKLSKVDQFVCIGIWIFSSFQIEGLVWR